MTKQALLRPLRAATVRERFRSLTLAALIKIPNATGAVTIAKNRRTGSVSLNLRLDLHLGLFSMLPDIAMQTWKI